MKGRAKKRKVFQVPGWLLIILLLASAGGQLTASERGADIRVWTVDDERYEGELLKVSDTGLLLFNHSTNREIQLEISKIDSISVKKETHNWLHGWGAGLLNALGAGLLGEIQWNSSESAWGNWPKEDLDKGIYVLFDGAAVFSYAILGGVYGLFADRIGSLGKSISFSFKGKNDSQIQKIIDNLQLYTRGKFDPYKKQRKLLGRFRISWRPFFYPIARELSPAGQYKPSPYLDKWEQFSLSQGIDSHPPTRRLRFQIDYDMSDWISTGLEFISLGHYSFYEGIFSGYSENQIYYISDCIDGEFGVKAALLSLNFTPSINKNRPSGFQLELGIGPAFSNFKFDNYCEINHTTTKYSAATSWTSLAYKAGAAWEFSPNSSLSFGLYCNYLYIPGTLPDMELSVPNPFTIEDGLAYMPMQIPRQKFNFGGLLIGALVRFR